MDFPDFSKREFSKDITKGEGIRRDPTNHNAIVYDRLPSVTIGTINTISRTEEETKAMVDAIVDAVNYTFGKGIDPKQIPNMVDALIKIRDNYDNVEDLAGQTARVAIDNAYLKDSLIWK